MTRCNFPPHWAGTNNMQSKVCLVLVSCCINAGQSVSFLREAIFLNHTATDSSNYQSPPPTVWLYLFLNFLLCSAAVLLLLAFTQVHVTQVRYLKYFSNSFRAYTKTWSLLPPSELNNNSVL